MMDARDHIVIVGGGTAGWIAALMLRAEMNRRESATRITVVESSKIGTIGVGEGTTAVFRHLLQHLGIDEMAFLRETGATIKYGIRHKDWRRLGHHYDGPIDDVSQVAPGIDQYAVAAGRPVSESHLFQRLIDKRRAPFARESLVPAGPFHHAFHFDQARAGAFLRRHAEGVEVVDDQVSGVVQEGGQIAQVVLESGARIEGDLFIDCSGFARALIGQLGGKWLSYSDILPVNRAMPFWVDIAEGEEIDPVTLAHAQGAGWMWKIPTVERYGCGYVYSDVHTTPEEAKAEIEGVLGHEIEPRNDIRIDAGRLEDSWIGNCVALGLSSSFLEPLEATSIHGTIVQLMMLIGWLDDRDGAAKYNTAHGRQVDDFRDFIRLHYVSERRDTAFWRDVAESHPRGVKDRVEQWRGALPKRSDFAPFPHGLPHVEEQLYTPVLDGLGLLDRDAAKAMLAAQPKRRAQLRKAHATLVAEYARAAGKCMSHRAFLDGLRNS